MAQKKRKLFRKGTPDKAVYSMSRGIPSSFTDELKKVYQKYLRRGLETAIVAHLFIIGIYILVSYLQELGSQEKVITTQQRVINVTLTDLEPPPSVSEQEEPPRVEEILSAPPKDLSALTPEPVAKEKADIQTIKTQKELEEIKTPISSVGDSGVYTYTGPIKIEEKKVEEKVKEERIEPEKTIYQVFEVEKPPECVNLAQVKGMMVYPEVGRQAGIEGRVAVKVLVGVDGSVIKVGNITGPEIFHDEVRSKSMNLQFTPGLQNGKPVKVWVTVPFNFKLEN